MRRRTFLHQVSRALCPRIAVSLPASPGPCPLEAPAAQPPAGPIGIQGAPRSESTFPCLPPSSNSFCLWLESVRAAIKTAFSYPHSAYFVLGSRNTSSDVSGPSFPPHLARNSLQTASELPSPQTGVLGQQGNLPGSAQPQQPGVPKTLPPAPSVLEAPRRPPAERKEQFLGSCSAFNHRGALGAPNYSGLNTLSLFISSTR